MRLVGLKILEHFNVVEGTRVITPYAEHLAGRQHDTSLTRIKAQPRLDRKPLCKGDLHEGYLNETVLDLGLMHVSICHP